MNTTPNNNAMPQEEPEAVVSRGEFMRSLGLSSAALMAFYCMGTLSSCKGSDPDPVVTPPPTGGTTGLTGNATAAGGAINFTMDLNNANYSALKTSGSFVNVGEVIVFNANGTYRALGRICTHAGYDISYTSSTNDLLCSGHSARYNTDGTPKSQPVGGGSITAVKAYSATLSGNLLTVKA